MESINIQDNLWTIAGYLLNVLTAAAFFILGISRRKPKLIGVGSGGGSGKIGDVQIWITNIGFRNDPTFLGMRISRETANIQSARIYDPENKELVGPALNWLVPGSREYQNRAEIEPGQQRQVMTFYKEVGSREFFVYSARSQDHEPNKDTARFTERRKSFQVHLSDNIGRSYKFKIIVRQKGSGLNVGFARTFKHRWAEFWGGLRTMLGAFSIGRR